MLAAILLLPLGLVAEVQVLLLLLVVGVGVSQLYQIFWIPHLGLLHSLPTKIIGIIEITGFLEASKHILIKESWVTGSDSDYSPIS